MKPTKFKECNLEYAKNQPEYNSIHVFKTDDGEVITYWKMSFLERLRVLFKGGIWLSLQTFNRGLTPSFMSTKKSDLIESEVEKLSATLTKEYGNS